jgi:NTE family protein
VIRISELRKNALFANVKVAEIRRILPKLQQAYYPRSAIICREGEQGNCLYIILSGQIKLTMTEDTHTKTLAYLNAGDFFGESAVLQNEPRGLTAEAVIDAEVLLLTRALFEELFERDPVIMHNILYALDQRIRLDTLGLFQPQLKQSRIVAVYSPRHGRVKTFVALNLAVSLARQTDFPVVILDLTLHGPTIAALLGMGEALTIGESPISEEQVKRVLCRHESGVYLATMSPDLLRTGKISREQVAGALGVLKTLFQYVVVNTSSEISNNTFEALDLSDMVVLLPPLGEEAPIGMFDHQEIITVYYHADGDGSANDGHPSGMAPLVVAWNPALEHMLYETAVILLDHDPAHAASRIIQKVARQVAGLQIGLALGGIAARGISHVGVLRVLEEHNISVDLIAGSNIGAVIGGAYALGIGAADLEGIISRWQDHLPLVSLRDFYPLRGGLLSNHRIMKLIAEFIPPHITFDDLTIPLRVITMALDTGKEVVLDRGSVLQAIEASLAMPGIFQPVRHNDQFLLDGSIINPVPLSDLVEMGADILVGVNSFAPLTPSYAPPPKRYTSLVGYAEKLRMIDVITRSFQNLQYEISAAKAMIADVMIAPEVLGYSWSSFEKAPGILEAGKKAARNRLPELQRVIDAHRKFKKKSSAVSLNPEGQWSD